MAENDDVSRDTAKAGVLEQQVDAIIDNYQSHDRVQLAVDRQELIVLASQMDELVVTGRTAKIIRLKISSAHAMILKLRAKQLFTENDVKDLPDVKEIAETLAVIEERDPYTTTVQRFDVDHGVLLEEQTEITEMLARVLPAKYRKDELRILLERIQNAIIDNRSKRRAAASRAQGV